MSKEDSELTKVGGVKPPIENPYERQIGGDHYNKKHDLFQLGIENGVGCGEFAAMKYIYRHKDKGKIEDLRKAHHMLQFLAYSYYGEEL